MINIKEKTIKIIKSCKTKEHVRVTINYIKLVERIVKNNKIFMYEIYEELTKKNQEINNFEN